MSTPFPAVSFPSWSLILEVSILPGPGWAGPDLLRWRWAGTESLASCSCRGWIPARAGVSPAKLNRAQEAPGWETYCLIWRFCSTLKCTSSGSCGEVKLLSFPLSCQNHSHFFLRKKQGCRLEILLFLLNLFL